jgi:hypothetical protein
MQELKTVGFATGAMIVIVGWWIVALAIMFLPKKTQGKIIEKWRK